MTRFLVAVSALALAIAILLNSRSPAQTQALDWDILNGHFYTQTGVPGATGFSVTNDGGILFWSEFQRLGGVSEVGYPMSRRFIWGGFVIQVFQRAIFQWRPEVGQVYYVNALDDLHDRGHDAWLEAFRSTPRPLDPSFDAGKTWEQIVRDRLALLDASPPMRERYFSVDDPLFRYGLPTSRVTDMGNHFAMRLQRGVLQLWKEDVPWARAGEVTMALAGTLVTETSLFPANVNEPEAPPGVVVPTPTPTPTSPARTRDWRTPGYVAAVSGQLYDPRFVPLRSIGTNVPNLAYRDGLAQNLEWMRQHRLRWMRVFATGHALGPEKAPRDAASAVTKLGALLAGVEQFNRAHDPSEAIYVLISLTDYYPPGVPGDRHAFDHPTFRLSPVLPAPWFRAGIRQFDFDQEWGLGWLYNMPNYEINYKPWMQQVVSSLAQSPALLGWQLGNELKARNSPRNSIDEDLAYDWYLAFTRDIVDTIRSLDRNHLIFMGAQYIAELVDWEYRPKDQLEPDRVPRYRQLVQRMLDASGDNSWNVWSLTAYDFNLYPLDDAATFSQAGVPVVATEYGFTYGTLEEMQKRFGGDRVAAVKNGLNRSWQDLAGRTQSRLWSVPELFANGPVAGIAPWGSPAPGPGSEFDMDGNRGITGMPDETALWAAWGNIAASLEDANRAAGPSASCQAFQSSPAR